MNDGWYNTLTEIRDESEEDAIINSWWDFGHWFAAIAERRVTLDGGRQNNPQAHWLGKLMLTSNEDESVGILRYLDCGANTGYNRLLEYKGDDVLVQLQSINLLYDILPTDDRDEARSILLESISEDEADEVLKYTHCEELPENYFITSEDMVGKSGVWAHFGAWDFERASMFNLVHNNDKDFAVEILEERFGVDDALDKYNEIIDVDADQWISPWPRYHDTGSCNKDGDIIKCENSMSMNAPQGRVNLIYETELDLVSEEAVVTNIIRADTGAELDRTEGKPRKVSFVKNETFIKKEYDGTIRGPNDREMGVAIYPSGNSYESVLSDYELTASIFTRLFFFEEYGGLEHFEKFHRTRDVNGQKIIVWKVDWP